MACAVEVGVGRGGIAGDSGEGTSEGAALDGLVEFGLDADWFGGDVEAVGGVWEAHDLQRQQQDFSTRIHLRAVRIRETLGFMFVCFWF